MSKRDLHVLNGMFLQVAINSVGVTEAKFGNRLSTHHKHVLFGFLLKVMRQEETLQWSREGTVPF